MTTETATTLTELRTVAEHVLESLVPGIGAQVITLTGDLGAGKTAFVKQCAKVLGITEEITSPTFVLMKSYEIKEHSFLRILIHIDAYRIESEDEARILKLDVLMKDPSALICIEWPERIPQYVQGATSRVTLTSGEGETRTITYGR